MGVEGNTIRYLQEETESVHMYLDDLDIPREGEHGAYSIVGRIKRLETRFYEQMSEVESFYLSRDSNH